MTKKEREQDKRVAAAAARRKAEKDAKRHQKPVHAAAAGPSSPERGPVKAGTPGKAAKDRAAAKNRLPSMAELRRQVKAKFPGVKGLADAFRDELVAVLDTDGDPGKVDARKKLEEQWKIRAKRRHDEWLAGDSPSAKAMRAKLKATAGKK